MTIKRAWNGTCVDGPLRDYFANAVTHRITQIDNCPGDACTTVELAKDFIDRCDAIFAQHNPGSIEAAKALAEEIDTAGLYELMKND